MSPTTALLVVLTTILLVACAWIVGSARSRYGIKAPATTGHPDFERAFRVQANTVESTLAFLPALLVADAFSPYKTLVLGLGIAWLLGRVLYIAGYLAAAEKRGTGFMIAGVSTLAMIVVALIGVIGALS